MDVSGGIAGRYCPVASCEAGRTVALAPIFRDHESLQAEFAIGTADRSRPPGTGRACKSEAYEEPPRSYCTELVGKGIPAVVSEPRLLEGVLI